VANAARLQMRGEIRLKRREESVARESRSAAGVRPDAELIELLRGAVAALDDKHRLPVALCCEEGLTHKEAAEVLDLPEGSVSFLVNAGLERLRKILTKAGYNAAPAAVLGALVHTAPPVPATLAAAVGKIVSGEVAGSGAGSAGAAMGVAAKGGIAMKILVSVVAAGVLAGAAGLSAFGLRPSEPRDTGSGPAAALAVGTNPVAGRQDREEVFEFAQKPTVTKQGDKVVIAFASKGKCDATVAIVSPEGKIVRHLASGVLGKNAPWPFKQDSLAQSLEWDGKDDLGKPAPAGCKVRVGLGLKAAHDRVIGWEPRDTSASALACDAEGNLYAVLKNDYTDMQVIVLDRDGRYVRTAVPFPANLAMDKLPTKLTKMVDGRTIPLPHRSGGGYYNGLLHQTSLPRHTPVLTPDGKVLMLVSSGHRGGRFFLRFAFDPAAPEIKSVCLNEKVGGEEQHGGVKGSGDLHMALSPDGQWIYFGSPAGRGEHVVYRGKLADVLQGKPPQPFLGEAGKPGKDETHFNCPRGVACDAGGNLHVADTANDRIQVFSAEGKFLRSFPMEKPEQLSVHPKTGVIYALRGNAPDTNVRSNHALVKLDKDGKPIAELPVKPTRAYDDNWPGVFCLDASAEEPVLWVCGGEGILKIADKGDKLEKVLSLTEEVRKANPQMAFVLNWTQIGLTVDPHREEIYFPSCAGWARADGRTGKILDVLKEHRISEMHVGPDRLVYARLGGEGYAVARYNPDDGKVVDFPKGTETHHFSLGGRDAGRKIVFRGQPTKGLDIMALGGGRTFQDGFGVAPNGDVWVILAEAHPDIIPELKKIGQGERLKGGGGRLIEVDFLQVWGPDGALKCISALPGVQTGQGIRVARNGNVYVGINFHPTGQAVPDGIDPKSPCNNNWGTLFRFDNAFDKFPIGYVNGPSEGKPVGAPTHSGHSGRNYAVEGLRWQYGGISPATLSGCICGNSRFDLDGFDRAFVPAMQTFSINVLDANGNLVTRIGSYGNADSRGADSPVVDPKTGHLRPKRPTDPADLKPPKELADRVGFRWVPYVGASDEAIYTYDWCARQVQRLKLGYAAEETVPVP
jgi:hypothetical protein